MIPPEHGIVMILNVAQIFWMSFVKNKFLVPFCLRTSTVTNVYRKLVNGS